MREFFDFRGRLSRLAFWRAWLVLQLFVAIAWIGGLFAIIAVGKLGGVIIALALPAYFSAVASCLVRRLHDQGKSGWWLFLFFGAPLLGAAAADRLLHSSTAGLAWAGVALSLAVLVANIWVLVEVGFRRGSPDRNVFGAPA